MKRTSNPRESSSDPERQREEAPEQSSATAQSSPAEALHAAAGNQAVKELYENGQLQPKLDVSQPADPQEREAERVAERVLNRSAEEPAVESVQRSVDTGRQATVDSETEQRIESLQGGGTPLSESTRSYFEPRFGQDFSDVRIHTGPGADRAARSINAEAFTLGTDIAFASGKYDPQSRQGKQLLAHELTHVAQQRGGAFRSIQRQDTGQETMVFSPEETNQETMTFTPDKANQKTATMETKHGERTLVAGPAEVEDTPQIVPGEPKVEDVTYVVDREVKPNGTVVVTLQTPDHGKMTVRNGPAYEETDFRAVLIQMGMPEEQAAEIGENHRLATLATKYTAVTEQLADGTRSINAYRAFQYVVNNTRPVLPESSAGGFSPQYTNYDIAITGVAPDLGSVSETALSKSLTQQLAKTAASRTRGMWASGMARQIASKIAAGVLSVGLLSISAYKKISQDVMIKDAVHAFSKNEEDRTERDWEAIESWRNFVESRLEKNLSSFVMGNVESGKTALKQLEAREKSLREKIVDGISNEMGEGKEPYRGPKVTRPDDDDWW